MLDQAAGLRELMRPTPRTQRPSASRGTAPHRRTRVIAVASGKGGVGKTSLTVNLAIALAGEGKRAIILDGDLGLANVDVMLGISPRWTLQHVVSGERELADVVTPAPGGIWVIPGGSGLEDLANLSDERRRHLIESLAVLDGRADFLLIDTAAGVSSEVSSFLAAAPEVLVVTTPEPTAITDAYALIKVAALADERRGAALGTRETTAFRLIVNQANDVGEATSVAQKIGKVAREFLQVDLDTLGFIPSDAYVTRAIRSQVPIVLSYPSSAASRRIVELARRLTAVRQSVKDGESTIITLLRRMTGVAAPSGLVPDAGGNGRGGV